VFTAHLIVRQVAAFAVWAKNKLSHPFITLFNFQRNVVILLDKWSPKTTRSLLPHSPPDRLTACLICNLRHLMMVLGGESVLESGNTESLSGGVVYLCRKLRQCRNAITACSPWELWKMRLFGSGAGADASSWAHLIKLEGGCQ